MLGLWTNSELVVCTLVVLPGCFCFRRETPKNDIDGLDSNRVMSLCIENAFEDESNIH